MKYKIKSTIEGDMTSVYYFMEGAVVGLMYDGQSKYESTNTFDIPDDKLDITARMIGLNGTDWKINLDIKCLDNNKYSQKLEEEDTIARNGTFIFTKTYDLKDVKPKGGE